MDCMVGGAIKREINLLSNLESVDEEYDCGLCLGESGQIRYVGLDTLVVRI